MTYREAIAELNIAIEHLRQEGHLHKCTSDAFDMAIYTLEKHVPKKLISTHDIYGYKCPNCKGFLRYSDEYDYICPYCGQHIYYQGE